jgi:glycosyltransferase involved in cell wall biosynthesis
METQFNYDYTPLDAPVGITEHDWREQTTPLICVRVMAYNHEAYIRDSIEGILKQKTTFRVRIVIHDDASTDKTVSIIREYEEQYPALIKVVYQPENTYRHKDKLERRKALLDLMIGKYVAICEGDDYWTNPLKLQKQVDFLEQHPEYSMAAGGVIKKNEATGEEEIIVNDVDASPDNTAQGFDITMERFHSRWHTETLTVVFRREANDLEKLKRYRFSRDVHLNYTLLSWGKGYYFKEVFGVYRIHGGGVFSTIGAQKQLLDGYHIYKELYTLHPHDFGNKFFKWVVRMLKEEKVETENFPSRRELYATAFRIADREDKMYALYQLVGWNVPKVYSLIIRTLRAFGKIK